MSAAKSDADHLISIGLMEYRQALALQEQLHREVQTGVRPAALLLLEHPAVLTLGKHSELTYVLAAAEQLQAAGVELVRIDRGGEVTAHMPGQLVVYPILPLQRWRLAPKAYVDKLLQCVILTLHDFGIEAYSDSEHPGVWVGRDKICAVGIRIKERISLHGLALNINNSLTLYQSIVPCGIRERGVCSMQSVLGKLVSRERVESQFIQHFFEVFAWSEMLKISS